MNNMYSAIIIDDEPNAIGLLKAALEDLYNCIEIKDTCLGWKEALPLLRTQEYDIIFLDISMPGKTGIDLLKMLPPVKSEIIFTTAHQEYALEALKLFATGYILKPVDDIDLALTMNKALERIVAKQQTGKGTDAQAVSNLIGIPDNKGVNYVDKKDIIYLEALNKCTRVVSSKDNLLSSYNLGKFKEMLPDNFCQIHRSFIINLDFIKRHLTSGIVIMENNNELPLSKRYRDDFLGRIAKVNRYTGE